MRVIWTVARVVLLPLFALFFVVTCAWGAVRFYTPVPENDGWDGYLHFYMVASQGGGWRVWLGFANEHRIFVTRLLFWLDLRYFGGLSLLLSPIHFVLLTTVWAQLCFAAWTLLREQRRLAFITCVALVVPCFSWLQRENLVWSYQSQFYFAYIFPLAAFQCFALSMQRARWGVWFAASVFWGCISALSMANGVFALPLLIAMTVFGGHRVRIRLAVLLPLTALVWWLYFLDFPASETAPASALESVKFGLAFLGGPVELLTGSMTLARIGGAIVLCGVFAAIFAWRRRFRLEPMGLALLAILAYVGIAASSAALLRAGFGGRTAVSDRYETAVLLGWSTIAVLLVAAWRDHPRIQHATLAFALLAAAALVPHQLRAFDAWGPAHRRRMMLGVLALDLGVKDNETGKFLLREERLQDIAEEAKDRNLSVFALPVMVRAREAMGRSASSLGLIECDGASDQRHLIAEDGGAFRVLGWAFDRKADRTPPEVYFVNAEGRVIGVGLTGETRQDVVKHVRSERASDSGMEGFMRTPVNVPIKLYCRP
jgi:hypothetical protein